MVYRVGLESSLQLLHNEAEVVLRIMLTDSVRIEQHILRILASERRGSEGNHICHRAKIHFESSAAKRLYIFATKESSRLPRLHKSQPMKGLGS